MSRRSLIVAALLGGVALGLAGCVPRAAGPAGSAGPAAVSPTGEVPLIERSRLFGGATPLDARLSPDGRWVSWMAPLDGVRNVWVAPADGGAPRALTRSTRRPVRGGFWSPDSKTVLFASDQDGDENFQLHGVDVVSGVQRNYTPFERTRAALVARSPEVPDRILIGLNDRDPRYHDVHSLDLATGRLTLVMRNEGYAGYLADDGLVLRAARRSRPDGGSDFHRIVDGRVEAQPFASVDHEDADRTVPLGYTRGAGTLYWSDSRGRDTAALVEQDVVSGRTTVLAQDPRADIGGALLDPATGRVQAYHVEYLKAEYVTVDDAVRADLAFLKARTRGTFRVTSRTRADDRWLVEEEPVTGPQTTWLYDRRAKSLRRLFATRQNLAGAPLVEMQPVEIRSRDGLTLVSYLSLPKAVDPTGSGRASRPVPMVLLVHGGPWRRDSHGYDALHQWLANRGYAVLSVNFRGSTGFGKAFTSAGDLEWGRRMQDDLLDAVEWAVAQGVTRREQVAIMGGSYGGYAVLAGLAFTPRAFACGVDIVGPSNLATLLANRPAYWESGTARAYRRVGDPTTEAGRALLRERSPLFAADRIERPLLIGQGANDPRVNIGESDRIVEAMKAKGIPVTYLVFPDEGHGFERWENNEAFFAVAENFLARCLGGRAQPIGRALKASTAQVRHGAEFLPALAEALAGP